MDTIYAKVAGLDVHHKTVKCAVRCQQSGKLVKQFCTFGTMTCDLRAMADCLCALDLLHAVASTEPSWPWSTHY